MWPYVLKVFVSATMLVAVAEIAKRSTVWGALLASLPVTSMLALVWLYLDTDDIERVADLSQNIFWLVLPSLLLFVLLPLLLKAGWHLWLSMLVASLATVVAYWAMLKWLGVRL